MTNSVRWFYRFMDSEFNHPFFANIQQFSYFITLNMISYFLVRI